MAPSAVSMSKFSFLTSQGTLLAVLKQMRAVLKSTNDVFALIQEIVFA